MGTHRYIYYLLLITGFLLSACSKELPEEEASGDDEQLPVVEVPIEVSIGTVWFTDNTGSKAAPPDVTPGLDVDGSDETAGIDAVRIIAFRRRDLDGKKNTDELAVDSNPFLYDPKNDQVVPCAKEVDTDHRLKARGTLKKTYGYEYRVIAIAYDADRILPYSGVPGSTDVYKTEGEEGLFSLNTLDGVAYDDFTVTLNQGSVWESFLNGAGLSSYNTKYLSRRLSYGPQFFYGFCHTGDENPVIGYSKEDANGNVTTNTSLTGVLYRGMAKVEVRLVVEQYKEGALYYDIQWMGLLADHVCTKVKLSDYDDFLAPSDPITTSGGKGSYTLVDFQDSKNNTGDNYNGGHFVVGKTVVFTAWMLPTKTRLGVRIRNSFGVADQSVHNCQIYVNNVSDAENATGVISPDAQGNIFYLRRNHKYVFTGKVSTLQNNELE